MMLRRWESQFGSIVGASGCGKTTFLRILDGLIDKSDGDIVLDGAAVTRPGPDRGFVFSDPSASVNGVDARYLPFGRRALSRPRALFVDSLTFSGELAYEPLRAGGTTLRVRASAR